MEQNGGLVLDDMDMGCFSRLDVNGGLALQMSYVPPERGAFNVTRLQRSDDGSAIVGN
jgi:hypothetical protein